MNLPRIKEVLCGMNYNSLRNREGRCETISVLAADALVMGHTPDEGAAFNKSFSPRSRAQELNKQMVLTIPPDDHVRHVGQSRAMQVWLWLNSQPSGKVYLFAQDDDHCYNFVVDSAIYLIDASTQFYQKVGTPGGATLYRDIPNYPYQPGFKTGQNKTGFRAWNNYPVSNTDFGFNYLSPQPLSSNDNLVIYDWGQLHTNWQ